jgi:hypothetical protein
MATRPKFARLAQYSCKFGEASHIFLKNGLWQMSESLASASKPGWGMSASLASPRNTAWQMSASLVSPRKSAWRMWASLASPSKPGWRMSASLASPSKPGWRMSASLASLAHFRKRPLWRVLEFAKKGEFLAST